MDYTIRYEKGNFQSGYAIVENQRVAVINKFYDTEGRINCLLDILGNIEVEADKLSEKTARFYRELNKMTSNENEVSEPSK